MATISVIIPSVRGREDYLKHTIAAYVERTHNDLDLIIEYDHPYVGAGWNTGVKRAKGEFFLFTADDLEPAKCWDIPAVESCRRGEIPCPGDLINLGPMGDRHLEEGQEVRGYGGDISVVPFCSRVQWEQIGPFIEAHYFTDSFFSHRCAKLGYKMVGRKGFDFVHYLAQPGRGAGMTEAERMQHDEAIYWQAVQADGGVAR